MYWQYTPYVLPSLVAAAVSAALALYTWQRRPAPGATPFALLMVAVVVWSLGHALELGSTDLLTKGFWTKIEFLGVAFVPVMWLAFALQHTGREKWLTTRNLVLLAIEPLVTLLLHWTNEVHGLIARDVRLDTSGSLPVLDFTYGAGFWVHTAYSYLLLLLGTFVLLQALIRSPRLYRGQAGTVLIAALAPWVGNVLYISGLSPFPYLDLTPFAFTITGLAVAWGLFRFRLLDIVPMARDTVIESMSDGVIVLDTQNRIVDLNLAAQRITSRPASEAIGQPSAQVFSAWPDLVERYRDVAEAREEFVLGEGEAQHCFDLHISPLYDRGGRLTGRLVVWRDITERKRAEEALQRQREELQIILDSVPALIFYKDKENRFIRVNRICAERLGRPKEKLEGKSCFEIFPPDQAEDYWGDDKEVMASGHPKRNIIEPVETSEGIRWVQTDKIPYRDEKGNIIGVIGFVVDVTERKRAEEALRASLLVDELTGLYNRRGFSTLGQQQLKTADRAKSTMSLLFADFDDLKQINDTLGHPEGDLALIEIASVLRETFRESDIIARIGGDEFVVLAIETDGLPTEVLTTRLQENLEAHNARGNRRYKLSLSMGIARYDPESPCSIDELLARADRLMYEQKQDSLEP